MIYGVIPPIPGKRKPRAVRFIAIRQWKYEPRPYWYAFPAHEGIRGHGVMILPSSAVESPRITDDDIAKILKQVGFVLPPSARPHQ